MFTLDETTVFYHSLQSSYTSCQRKGLTDINNWAADVDSQIDAGDRCHTSRTSFTIAASLNTVASRQTKKSPLTDNILITSSQDSAPKNVASEPHPDVSMDDISGGLSDEDEMHGLEREEALSSPPKGKNRATSSVSCSNRTRLANNPTFLRDLLKSKTRHSEAILSRSDPGRQTVTTTVCPRDALMRIATAACLFLLSFGGLPTNRIPGISMTRTLSRPCE